MVHLTGYIQLSAIVKGHPGMKIAARIGLVILIALAAWILVSNAGKWLEQIRTFSWTLNWPMLLISTLLLGTSYYFTPEGWVRLAGAAGCDADRTSLRSAWLLSQLGRYVPGKIWLLAGRAGYLKANGLSAARSTSVPFLEILYTAAAAGLTGALPILFSDNLSFGEPAIRAAIIASGACLLLIPLLSPLQRLVYRIRYGTVPDKMSLPSPAGAAWIIGLYTALWIIRGAALYMWLRGFGLLSISPLACISAAPFSWLAGYIVFLVPGGIGVREAAAVAMIAPAGMTGPVLAVVAGQRLALSAIEICFALKATRSTRLLGQRKVDR